MQHGSRGALAGRLTGDTGEKPLGGRVEVYFEGVATRPGVRQAPPPTQSAPLSKEKTFSLAQLEPGEYLVSVRAGPYASRPQKIEILANKIAEATFETGGGGTLVAQVTDTKGQPVDPVGLTLLRVESDGKEVMIASYAGRAGRVSEDGLLPGTYRLEAWATGLRTLKTESFQLQENKETRLPTLVMRPPAWLRLGSVQDESGRAPKGETHLSLREGSGEFKPLWLLGKDIAVNPGPVTVRATTDDGLAYEETLEAKEGEVLPVAIVLKAAPR